MPDHPLIINPHPFIWQLYDEVPKLPKLNEFLHFWTHELRVSLAGVRVAHYGIIGAHEMKHIGNEWRLN